MIQIGVCDDDQSFLQLISKEVGKQFQALGLEYEIHLYHNSNQVMQYFGQENHYLDLLLLDIELGEINGLELGKWLNEKEPTCFIAFLTGHMEYALTSYQVVHYDYIFKENDLDEQLEGLMKVFFEVRSKLFFERLVVQNRGEGERVYLDQNKIMYLERNGRVTNIYCIDGEHYTDARKLSELLQLLNCNTFVQCHKSFIVNKKYIKQRKKLDWVLTDGTCIRISRTYKDKLKDKLKDQF